jgi:hypothetical protein
MNIQYYLDAYNCLKYIKKSLNTWCVSESGDFAKLFFLVRQYWGGCRHHHFAVNFNPLNAELNPICHLLALLGAHPIFHASRIRVKAF